MLRSVDSELVGRVIEPRKVNRGAQAVIHAEGKSDAPRGGETASHGADCDTGTSRKASVTTVKPRSYSSSSEARRVRITGVGEHGTSAIRSPKEPGRSHRLRER